MFNIGDFVKIKNTNLYGIINKMKINKNKTLYYVQINNKNILVSFNDLEKASKLIKTTDKNNKITNHDDYYFQYNNHFTPEITIRHQTLDIAMYNVENFVAEAIQNNIKNLKVIHGRNGGILRKAVHDFLKNNKNVESFRLGNYYEGSYGVTIIKLK